MCDVYEEAYFSRKMLTNRLKVDLTQRAWVEKTALKWKHWHSGKEKILGEAVSKESHADTLLGHEKPMTIDFLEKGATVNCCSIFLLPTHEVKLILFNECYLSIYQDKRNMKF